MQCVGCLSEIKGGVPTTINERGDQLCQICTFIVAMYQENGVDKHFDKGGLQLHLISNTIRKAVKELIVNPRQTYEKYVPKTLERAYGIEISDEMMKGILTEEFPFVKLPLRQAEELNLKEGELFRAHSADGGFFRRQIHGIKKFTAKEARARGYGRDAFVAYFVPDEG